METFDGAQYGLEDADLHSCFEVASALYWYCADYHGGQNSAEYLILSALEYKPGACENGPEEDSTSELIYQDLADGALNVEDVYAWLERNYADAKRNEDE